MSSLIENVPALIVLICISAWIYLNYLFLILEFNLLSYWNLFKLELF